MNYFIFNKIDSRKIKSLIVNELPHIIRPTEKVEKYEIANSNGTLINSTGYFSTTTKLVECTIKNLDDIDKIFKWLIGSGTVIFSNQPDREYRANIINQIPFERVISQYRKFIIEFECQPFAYLSEGKESITLENTGTIINIGTVASEPIITIYGAGDVLMSIGQSSFVINNIDEFVTVDTPLLEIYKENKLMNKHFVGDFPTFETKEIPISWVGNVKKIKIIPNWRFL